MSSPSGPSQPSQTADPPKDPPADFKSMLDAALIKYKEKTGKDLQAIWLASELQTCDSVDSVVDLLRDQAKTLDRSDDQKLMGWIDPLVHVLSTFSDALGDGVSLAFPPAKVIFTGIGVLLGAAKDARASQGNVIDLFERIESFFKRLEVYNQISLNTKMAEVLVKILIELLSILSIATKEVGRRRAKLFARKLLGRTDIEDALKRLDSLIQEEFKTVMAQILKVATEVKDGVDKTNIAMQQVSSDTEEVRRDVVEVKCDVVEVKHGVVEVEHGVVEVKHGVEEVKRKVEEVKWAQIDQDIQKWFSPPDPSTNFNIACEAQHEGTATWFFQGRKFEDWMSLGSLLWINGKPGSGKSILCSAIIKRIIPLRDAGQASLAYFFFDFRDKEKKQDFRNFITSLLVQLSAYSRPCCRIISRLYSTHGKGTQQPSNDALKTCLREMLVVAARKPIYIIVDALDECPNLYGMPTPRAVVLSLLKDLVSGRFRNLYICVTSRPEIDIKNIIGPLARSAVSLHEESGQMKDISDFIRNVVYSDTSDSMMRTWRGDQKELVIEELSKKADGMFRWVFCQLEVLRHCFPASIRQILDHLPESLDDTYLHVLRQIPQANKAHAHRMLQCILVAVRPLRVEELAEVLAFEFDAAQEGIPKYRAAWRLDDQTQAVLSTCSSLVTIVNSDSDSDSDRYRYRYWDFRRKRRQVVQFSHFSVKEFLMSNRLGDFSQYHIHPLSAHTIFTQACLGVLLHLDNNGDTKIVRSLPLARYAAQHWVKHAQFQGVVSRVKNGLETLFDPDEPHFAAWLGIYNMEGMAKPSPLYYAVLCGFYDLVEHLAIKHPQHVNAISGRYTFPLFAALEKDHIEIAELLLKHSANVDAREPTGETMLLKALSRPRHNLLSIVTLLKHGADVNARTTSFRSSLHLAEYIGELKVAHMLLDHKPDVNSQDEDGRTPLHILLECQTNNEDGALNHARLLFERGAELNRRDKHNQTPLLLAIGQDWFKFTQTLLEQGADANAGSYNGKTPLLALLSGCWMYNEDNVLKYAQLILKHGAKVNTQDKNNQTPLLLAVGQDRFELMHILLEHGADANAVNNEGVTPLYKLLERHIHVVGDVLNYTRWLEHGVEVNRYKGNQLLLEIGHDSFMNNKTTETGHWQHGSRDHIEPVLDMNAQDANPTGMRVPHFPSNFSLVQNVEALLDHGANANSGRNGGEALLNQDSESLAEGMHIQLEDKNQLTPLHLASLYGRLDVARVLLDNGATAHSRDNFDRTPLHLTAKGTHNFEQDRIRIAKLLLPVGRGVDVNAQDKDGETPLHLASYDGRVAMARVLLDSGAAANSKDEQGRTPLHSVVSGRCLYSKDDGICVAELLLEHGADVNAADCDERTPLHLASYYGGVAISRVLLDRGAVANSRDKRGRTPLHTVAEGGYPYSQNSDISVAQLLLEHGADIDAPDQHNKAPLHLASYYGRVEMVLALLNAGASTRAKDAQGQTPLHQVSQGRYYSQGDGVGVARLLLEHGAEMNAQDRNLATPSDLASCHRRTKIASLFLHYQLGLGV